MRRLHIPIIGIACIAATACVTRTGGRDSELSREPSWSAILQPTAGSSVRGSAAVVGVDNNSRSRVVISIAGSRVNAVHPWDIHEGSCGGDGSIVGRSSMYPPVPIGGAGAATMSLELPIQLRSRARYYVNVHEGPARRLIVACGPLLRDAPMVAGR